MGNEKLEKIIRTYGKAVRNTLNEGRYLSGREIEEALKLISEWAGYGAFIAEESFADCMDELHAYDAGTTEEYWVCY